MKLWFTSKELAEIQPPGLPGTERGIQKRFKPLLGKLEKEGKVRKRQGRGGGWEYHISCLPPETQEYLLTRGIDVDADGNATYIDVVATEIRPDVQASPAVDATRVTATSAPTEPAQMADRVPAPDSSRSVSSLALTPSPSPKSGRGGQDSTIRAIVRVTIPEEEPTGIPKRERVAIARAAYIQAQLEYCADRGIPAVDCEYEFCQQLKAGLVRVYGWVRRLQKPPSRSSLCRWKTEARQENLLGMAPGQKTGRPSVFAENEILAGFVIAAVCKWPHVKYSHLYRVVRDRFPNLEATEPTVRRFVQRWKQENKGTFALLCNPDDWKNRFLPAFGSYSEGVTALNDLWELDSTPADVMLADGRYAIVGCIDVYSRRAKLLVTKTSKAVAIIALLRRCILDWGVPRAVKTDNGKDYTAFHIQHTLEALQIDHRLCQPFSPEQKPHVERFLGTFLHDFLELLPGYIGHSVGDRKKIESRKSFAERFGDKAIEVNLDLKTFQAFCDNWCEGDYDNEVHGTTGKSPAQMAVGQPIRTIENERQLDLLMAETATRTVQKKGIKIEGRWFIAPDLAPRIGEQVHLRLPQDAGIVYVFTDPSCTEFICVAEDPDCTGANRQEIARKAKLWRKQQAEAVRNIRKLIKETNLDEVPMEMVEASRQAAAKIEVLPGQKELAQLPASSAQAVDQYLTMTSPQEPIPLTPVERQHIEKREQAKAQQEAKQNSLTPMQREMIKDFPGWFDREIFNPLYLEKRTVESLLPEVQAYIAKQKEEGWFQGHWKEAMSRYNYRTTPPKAM